MFNHQESHEEEGSKLDPSCFPLDRYQPLKQIGIGATGSVYLCLDRQSQDPVAVKILHELHGEQFRSFETEARTMTNIKHPNIVELLGYGATEAGMPYMCLEYFPGTRLADYIEARGRLPIPTALTVFADLADALFVVSDSARYFLPTAFHGHWLSNLLIARVAKQIRF
ncbi:MAG: protein kinase [Candidatus Melainabacteria bacterium]|nr:protein kinase [Candidatus Melainabacteria bacterium]